MTLVLIAIFQYTDVYSISRVVDSFGEFLIAAVIIADITSVYWYFHGLFVEGMKWGDITLPCN